MANWLTLKGVHEWDFSDLRFFQYDSITDAQIEQALADLAHLEHVNCALDWEDDEWLAGCSTIPDEDKHTYRVAALVRQFKAGVSMEEPILLDTFLQGRCGCCIGNGHHRLRALEFLAVPAAPFGLAGDLDPLEDLVRTAGTSPAEPWAAYFSAALKEVAEDDVTLD